MNTDDKPEAMTKLERIELLTDIVRHTLEVAIRFMISNIQHHMRALKTLHSIN